MRIAILADPLDNQHAGIHVYTREMVNALIRNGSEHHFILLREKKDPELDRYANVEQITVPNIRLPIGFASIRLFFIFPLILNFKRPDWVVEPAHFGPFNLFPWIRRMTIIHDLTPILFPKLHRWHSQFLQNVFLKGILKRTHLILANSLNTANDIKRRYPKLSDKVHFIYPGKSEVFKPAGENSIPENYGVKGDYFMFLGTIEPRKNLIVLLEAYKLFRDQHPELKTKLVVIGGRGWKSESFFELLELHSYKADIIRPGFIPTEELPAFLSMAQALVYPSRYEGFGLPVLEAMACGCPVITARNSSLLEVGGDAALFHNTTDILGLSRQMAVVAKAEADRPALIAKCLRQAEQFSWDQFSQEFLGLVIRK